MDERLIGMVLEIFFEHISLDANYDLEEIWILGNCFGSSFILRLVLWRKRNCQWCRG